MNIITVTRGSKGANRFRSYKIFIDEEFVGKIKRKETLNFEVSEGEHKVKCKIDWESSNELKIDTVESPIHLMVNAKDARESVKITLIPGEGKANYLTLVQLDKDKNSII